MQLKVVEGTFEMVSCIAYNNGVLMTSHLDMRKVSFHDYLSTLSPKIPSRKEDLKAFLTERALLLMQEQKSTNLNLRQRNMSTAMIVIMMILSSRLGVTQLWSFVHQISFT